MKTKENGVKVELDSKGNKMLKSPLRGHEIYFKNRKWYYCDTHTPTAGKERSCGHCGGANTPDGHDSCLGVLSGIMNACCGHGITELAYVQYWNGDCVRGAKVVDIIQDLRCI